MMQTRDAAFGPLRVSFDQRVLEPRAWTALQSEWAAEIAPALPEGSLLELCAGAGQIGLLAAHLSGRSLVQVEADAVAAGHARTNAAANGLASRVDVRHAPLERALHRGERFPLILADPPYLPTNEIGRFPDDPSSAIDGGADGLDLIRACLEVIAEHLAHGGAALLQVAGPRQADAVAALAVEFGFEAAEERVFDSERAVVLLRRTVLAATGRSTSELT